MYKEMLEYVRHYLENSGHDSIEPFTFRKRSMHCYRVYLWAKRLINSDELNNINKEAILVSAIFHDIGYGMGKCDHAENSAVLCRQYLNQKGYEENFRFLLKFVYIWKIRYQKISDFLIYFVYFTSHLWIYMV